MKPATLTELREAVEADTEGRWNALAVLETAERLAGARVKALDADSIRNVTVKWSISDFYGLADWATFEAGIAKGLDAAANHVEAALTGRAEP